jgi:protein-disulfide isomerase
MHGENKFLIPLAVVVAGVLIAGALIFRGGFSGGTPPTSTSTTSQDIAIAPLSAADHILGDPNAPITMIEFSDIDCPFCREFDLTMRQLMDLYGKTGQVSWVYRNFPLDELHPNARAKAEAAECVASLAGNDAYWKFLGTLFDREDETMADLPGIAASVGVDAAAYQNCVTAGTFKQKVQKEEDAAFAAGARGTPYTIVVTNDGTKIPISGALPLSDLKQLVQTLIANMPATAAPVTTPIATSSTQ